MTPVTPVLLSRSDIAATLVAKDQDEYETLPAVISEDGVVVSRWQLTDDEIRKITESKSLYLMQSTFHHPVQPIILTVDEPHIE